MAFSLNVKQYLHTFIKNQYVIKISFIVLFTGRTRTKDKYRVVYSDHQRLELEKEFHYSRSVYLEEKLIYRLYLTLKQSNDELYLL